MEWISTIVKISVPNYFKNLPIPNSFDGFANLAASQWMSLFIFTTFVAIIILSILKLILPSPPEKPSMVNLEVKKDNPKVVDLFEIEDLDKDKVSYCRCWRSKEFPICDGSHNIHNELTKDNVGPLVIKRKVTKKC